MEIIREGSAHVEYVPSKSSVKRDLAYVREMCRQIEAAMKDGNWDDAMDAANEGSACLGSVMENLGAYKAVAEGSARVLKTR